MEPRLVVYSRETDPPDPAELETCLREDGTSAEVLSDARPGEPWSIIEVRLPGLAEPVVLTRCHPEDDPVLEDGLEMLTLIEDAPACALDELRPALQEAKQGYLAEAPAGEAADALLALIGEWLASRTNGIYFLEGRGFFDEDAECILAVEF